MGEHKNNISILKIANIATSLVVWYIVFRHPGLVGLGHLPAVRAWQEIVATVSNVFVVIAIVMFIGFLVIRCCMQRKRNSRNNQRRPELENVRLDSPPAHSSVTKVVTAVPPPRKL